MKRLVIVVNTYRPSLICLAKFLFKPPPKDGSPVVIANELENNFIEICSAIHNYSFDIFAYRVTKRKDKILDIRGYIEQDKTHFSQEQRSTLLEFLIGVKAINILVANAQATGTKELPTTFIEMLLSMYSFWKKDNLLLKDLPADRILTLLDLADAWLADSA